MGTLSCLLPILLDKCDVEIEENNYCKGILCDNVYQINKFLTTLLSWTYGNEKIFIRYKILCV